MFRNIRRFLSNRKFFGQYENYADLLRWERLIIENESWWASCVSVSIAYEPDYYEEWEPPSFECIKAELQDALEWCSIIFSTEEDEILLTITELGVWSKVHEGPDYPYGLWYAFAEITAFTNNPKKYRDLAYIVETCNTRLKHFFVHVTDVGGWVLA